MSRHHLPQAPADTDRARRVLNTEDAHDEPLDRAALAKELLAAVDERHAEAGGLRAGNEPVAVIDPAPTRSSRHRRTSGAHARRPVTVRRPVRRPGVRRGRTLLLVAGVAAGLLAVPAVGVAVADQCGLQRAAHELILALDGHTDDRSAMLRNALTQTGVGPQLSAGCAEATTAQVGRTGDAAAVA
nr:hypothetical protein [Pseudonocardiales bacterium]